MTPVAGETVLLVPQAYAWLMNSHDKRSVIGQPPRSVTAARGRRVVDAGQLYVNLPQWTTYTSDLLRKGFGLLVVRDGKLSEGPTDWDSGD